MENVVVTGMKGTAANHSGIRGAGYKIRAPYAELAAESRKTKTNLLNLLHASAGSNDTPLVYTVSPPEKINSMDDVHTLYVLVDENTFPNGTVPDDLVRLEVPAQSCIHFHFQGPLKNSTDFYFELFARIRDGEIDYDNTGYRIEEYGESHNWDDFETPNNEFDIFFPVK